MQVSQARAERLILGEETFKIVSEPGISEHAPGSFMLRAYVKTGRRQETIRVASNTAFNTGRFDGGSNYTNRLAAAQAAPRFKLWLECGKPEWEEFHRGLSDAAKAELKRQGSRARHAKERRMYVDGRSSLAKGSSIRGGRRSGTFVSTTTASRRTCTTTF